MFVPLPPAEASSPPEFIHYPLSTILIMTTPISPPEVMTRLRQFTSQIHKTLEELPFSQAILKETLPLPLYIGQLEAYLPVYRALEKQCVAQLHFPAMHAIWQADLAKTPWLVEDLAYFKYTEIPAIPVQRATIAFLRFVQKATPYDLLGILYTMEGSTLGSRVLLPHLQTSYSLQNQGVQYYFGYGENTDCHWQDFKARMNSTLIDLEAQNQVIESALQTFAHVKSLLTVLWESG